MTEDSDVILSVNQVSRSYPRDILHAPSAILREMLWPLSLLQAPKPDSFFALRDVSLRLSKGQKLGVIGTHRSGKSTLAGIASGLLQPTCGSAVAHGTRLLINRPTAGFKPTLTTIENLSTRANLAGLHGELLDAVLEKTLSNCGVGYLQACTPMGNVSPYIVKQLGLTLLLMLPADILIVDETNSAGIGDARWATRGLLQEKINSSTSLVISSDLNFISDVAEHAVLLHHGRLYGPFGLEQAIDYFNQLPDEDYFSDLPNALYNSMQPPTLSSQANTSLPATGRLIDESSGIYESTVDDEDIELNLDKFTHNNTPPWKILNIRVDGEDFRYTQFSLLRRPGDLLNVSVEMVSLRNQTFKGGIFSLFSGKSGLEVGQYCFESEETPITINQKRILYFQLKIPDWQENFYGLTFSPKYMKKYFSIENRMKILIFGTGENNRTYQTRILEISKNSFNKKNENDSIDKN
jgi:ABC-type polysaccharide/polyol phosphate transport system ATPase subunit